MRTGQARSSSPFGKTGDAPRFLLTPSIKFNLELDCDYLGAIKPISAVTQ